VNSHERKRSYRVEAVARACDILASFTSTSEVLDLKVVTQRSGLNKVTTFRLLGTLVEKGLIDSVGQRGYRSRIQPVIEKPYRIGYALQDAGGPFTAAVTDSVVEAAYANNIDLMVLNNGHSPSAALRNAEKFVNAAVDLVIESQISTRVMAELASRFSAARIPYMVIDTPHPGATYFGADNYKAGRIAGEYLGQWASSRWNGAVDQIAFAEMDAAGHALDARLAGMYDGIIEVLPQCRNIPVYHYGTGGRFEKALDVFRRHIRLHFARKLLIGVVNDSAALAALQALREIGGEETCAIAGQGASIKTREEMRRKNSSLVCSVAFFPENYGAQVIRLATDILKGRRVPPALFTSHALVTAANIDKIYPNDKSLRNGLVSPVLV
jgi:ribose transport system substrate-binding protein